MKNRFRPKLIIAWGLAGGGGGLIGTTLYSWDYVPFLWSLSTLLISFSLFIGSVSIGKSHNHDLGQEKYIKGIQ